MIGKKGQNQENVLQKWTVALVMFRTVQNTSYCQPKKKESLV